MKSFVTNLRMAHKFMLVAAIALVMLTVPSAMVLSQGYRHWQSTHTEVAGLAPAGATLELIRLTQQHRGLSSGVLAGNTEMVAPRQAKADEVQRALAATQVALALLPDAALQRAADRLATGWQALAAEVASKALPGPQSFARHTTLIAEQLNLLDDIASSSGIVLQEEPALHFLQAAMLRTTPLATETLGQMRARGSALLTRGEASAEDKARLEGLLQQYRRARTDSGRLLDGLLRHDAALHQALGQPLAQVQHSSDAAIKLLVEQILNADKLNFPAPDYFAATTRAIDDEFKLIDAGFKLLAERLVGDATAARSELVALTLGLLALAALAAWVMRLATLTTTAALTSALQLAREVAAGDLRSHLQPQGRDEIAELLRALVAMNEGLAGVVSGVRHNAESVATASAEIAQGNLDLSNRTEQQAAALQQTAATMDELGSTVRSTAEHAQQASALAEGASAVALRGSEAMSAVVQTMQNINQSSHHIAEITGTIDGIAFQTNILALNAAVEAARAGEQGRGFAVVAGEVRQLAQRAAEAARQIKRLIGASVESVECGTQQVDRAGATMGEVVDAIQRVRAIVAEISQASREQSTGVSQVGEAVTQMDHSTQQNAALVEQSAAAAASLRMQAQQLVQGVAAFKLRDAGASPALAAR